jgi:hypothetical protein
MSHLSLDTEIFGYHLLRESLKANRFKAHRSSVMYGMWLGHMFWQLRLPAHLGAT